MRLVHGIVSALLLLVAVPALAAPKPSLQSLYETDRWFELRDRVDREGSPGFHRAAVAAAFHDVKRAETELNQVIQTAPHMDEAYEAHSLLANLYIRLGRPREVLSQLESMIAHRPESPDARATRPLFELLSRYPAQSVTSYRASNLRYSSKGGSLRIPVSVNDQDGSYILDTGANFSLTCESEAGRLGMVVHDVSGQLVDSTGAGGAFRVAVADRLAIGDVALRHVVFLVVRDDQPPFADLPPGERGVVGLPVLLALEAIHWDRDVTLEIRPGSRRDSLLASNLFFHDTMPVVRGRFGKSDVTLVLDTGAVRTDLWARFGRDFSGVLTAAGRKSSRRVTGIGSSIDVESVALPEVALKIGGFRAVLRPAEVLARETGRRRRLLSRPAWDGRPRPGAPRRARLPRDDLEAQVIGPPAGTLNGNGELVVETTKAFEDNTVSRIIHLVESAQAVKGRTQVWVERFGRVYSPLVLGVSLLLALAQLVLGLDVEAWLRRAVPFLVAASPCALAVATPVTIVAGIGAAAWRGVLIKGGNVLDLLGRVTGCKGDVADGESHRSDDERRERLLRRQEADTER